uniref:Thymidylate synthase n=1 Tax=Wuchereria bancrofti TaxID=6293 RepID=A0AAF5RY41_WUCBA
MKPSGAYDSVRDDASVLQNEDENKYLDQVRHILKNGERIDDRTGIGTISVTAMVLRGDTNAKHLSEKDVKIWDANGSRQFLDQCGFNGRSEGDLGPIYGFQYRGMDVDYTNQGIDQLSEITDLIKNELRSRRIILNAWNVKDVFYLSKPALDIKLMALPPCHTLAQFAVRNGELSCQLYQRSGDTLLILSFYSQGLEVLFNLTSCGLLTHMIAHFCGFKTGHLCHVLGDAHVCLKRQRRQFPTVRFVGNIKTIDISFTSQLFLKITNRC